MPASEATHIITLAHATLVVVGFAPQSGAVTLERWLVPTETGQDAYLVFRLSDLDIRFKPSTTFFRSTRPGWRCYRFRAAKPESEVVLEVPEKPIDGTEQGEDLAKFETALAQHVDIRDITMGDKNDSSVDGMIDSRNESLRGHLVIVNQDTGQVVGQLDDATLSSKQDLNKQANEHDPVVIELDNDGDKTEMHVHAITPDDQDWFTESTTSIVDAITNTASLVREAINTASANIISNTTPFASSSRSQPETHSKPFASSTPIPVPYHPTYVPKPKTPTSIAEPKAPTSSLLHNGLSIVNTLSAKAAEKSSEATDLLDSVVGRWSGLAATKLLRNTGNAGEKSDENTSGAEGANVGEEEGKIAKLATTANRVLFSADLILSALDTAARQVLDASTDSAKSVIEHKFGSQAAQSTALAASAARNVVLLYIDMQGIGRRVLVRNVVKGLRHQAKPEVDERRGKLQKSQKAVAKL